VINDSTTSVKTDASKIETAIIQSEYNLYQSIDKLMKQLDNTPLNFISNEQDENQLINQVDLRLNENINNIDSTLTGIKNTINKEISNLDLKITKSLHEQKVEVVNNVNNVSSLVNEM